MALHRRTLLRTGLAGSIAALAGCSNPLAGGSDGATFADWLYAPGTVADTDHYLSLRYEPSGIADRAGEFDGDVYDALRAFGSDARETVGFRFAGTDAQLVFGKNSVLTADFEASEVDSTLKDDEFVATGSYGDFDQYLGPDENTAVGVGSEAVVVARSSGIFGGGVQAATILQAIVDAHNGDRERYIDASPAFETLTDALGDGALQSARTHPETDETDTDDGEFAGEVARGIDSQPTDEGIETTFALVFTEESAVDTVAVEDWWPPIGTTVRSRASSPSRCPRMAGLRSSSEPNPPQSTIFICRTSDRHRSTGGMTRTAISTNHTVGTTLFLQLFLPSMSKTDAVETTQVTDKGQTTIPKPLREKFGIEPGDEVVWIEDEDGITVRKRTDDHDAAFLAEDMTDEEAERVAQALIEDIEESQSPNIDL